MKRYPVSAMTMNPDGFGHLPVDAGVFVYIIRGSNEKGVELAKGAVVLVR
jgi:hypothetical protein